jgi:phosphatidylethanolamine/phosphatidyl-N-methylethanolamine N-methyltransferase
MLPGSDGFGLPFRESLLALRRRTSRRVAIRPITILADKKHGIGNTLPMSESDAITKSYAFFAPLYDLFFGKVLEAGRRTAVHLIEPKIGARILEVGVGTGLSLACYPAHTRVTGIDVSPAMLAKAQARVERQGLRHVAALLHMDATAMEFEDNRFDAAICMYVVSVVSNPIRLLEEMRRVCKPDGKLVVVNHFRTHRRLVRMVEFLLKPFHRMVHFRSGLDLDDFTMSVQLPLEHVRQENLLGYSTVLVFRNTPGTIPSKGEMAAFVAHGRTNQKPGG